MQADGALALGRDAGSCVIITMVWPLWLSAANSARISAPVRLSSAPVGSSASTISGEAISARAIATR